MPQRIGGAGASRRAHFLAFVLLAALPGCSGCAGTVTGKVTVGAAPATSGTVVFTGADGVPFSTQIDAHGHYQLTKLPAGEMKISVVNSMVSPGAGPVKNPDAPPAFSPTPPIPQQYASPDNGLKITVQGGTQIHDIDLRP